MNERSKFNFQHIYIKKHLRKILKINVGYGSLQSECRFISADACAKRTYQNNCEEIFFKLG